MHLYTLLGVFSRVGKVQVLVPASLRQYWGGGARLAADVATLADAIASLGPLSTRILDDQGDIRPHVNVFVNHVAVKRLDHALTDGDIIHIPPAVSGGSP